MQIKIYLKPISWNTLARKHYRVYQKVFTEWHEATHYALLEAKAKPLKTPVRMTATAYWKGKRRCDISNIVLKPVEDAIVAFGIIPDDSTKYVSEVILRGIIGAEEDMLEVRIESL